jgi:biopolymer transport protein ExbD
MKINLSRRQSEDCVNMTPMIDVVFLLITFFILVGTYTTQDSLEVVLPDKIVSGEKFNPQPGVLVTITVMQKDGQACYSADSDILPGQDARLLEKMITSAIDGQELKPGQDLTVCLRCDKQIAFKDVRPVLEGIAKSSAEKIQWAIVKD